MNVDSVQVLRAARQEAIDRGLGRSWQATALVLAGHCAALIKLQSSGFIRRGLPPVDKAGATAPVDNPTFLRGE